MSSQKKRRIGLSRCILKGFMKCFSWVLNNRDCTVYEEIKKEVFLEEQVPGRKQPQYIVFQQMNKQRAGKRQRSNQWKPYVSHKEQLILVKVSMKYNTYKYEISNCQHLLGHLKKGKRIHEKHLLLFHWLH